MKRIIGVLGMLCITMATAEEREIMVTDEQPLSEEVLRKNGLDEKTKKILAQFANIVIGFFNIVQDPNNAAHVTAQVTDMINNAVNIVTESVKKGELPLDATEEELQAFAEGVKKRLMPIS